MTVIAKIIITSCFLRVQQTPSDSSFMLLKVVVQRPPTKSNKESIETLNLQPSRPDEQPLCSGLRKSAQVSALLVATDRREI